MFKKLVYISVLAVFVSTGPVFAQQLKSVNETEKYTDYQFSNTELEVFPPYELTAPVINGSVRYEILTQSVKTQSRVLSEDRALAFALSSTEKPLVEVSNIGITRGQETASLKINLARYSKENTQITENIIIRVYKEKSTRALSRRAKAVAFSNHPLSSGTWYKIPITKRGIYALDEEYLTELGLDVESINPRNIQLWGTDGYVLQELTDAERPEFSQLPILVQGENDGSFDEADQVVFFGNSPHREFRSTSSLVHQIHPYTDTTYVFLTVGSNAGTRLSTANAGLTPTRTITTFQDFIWKEEELYKTESAQKTGRYWLGQKITASAQNQFISIFSDTLPDLGSTPDIRVSGRIYARSQSGANFRMEFNNNQFSSFTIGRLGNAYNDHTGTSANSFTFSNVGVSPIVEDGILDITLLMSGGDSGAEAFVEYLRLYVQRSLTAKNDQLFFFSPEGGTDSEIAQYQMSGFSDEPIVLDVTEPMQPRLLQTSSAGNTYNFNYNTDEDNKILAQTGYYTPRTGRLVPNQNLHSISTYPDYVVVTAPYFMDYAQQLADRRAGQGLTPVIVTQDQILNEFSGGSLDPTAIRDFMKFLYDEAIADGQEPPKYLLLFGDTTYDTKEVTASAYTNYVLTYQSSESIHRTNSYGTDDYFGYLDDGEGLFLSTDRVDVGIGRISAQSRSEANVYLDKIRRYEDSGNNGDWQSLFTFAGDDDFPDPNNNRDLHVLNADGTAESMSALNDVGGRLKKIYLFAYPEEITGAGRQIPGATRDFMNSFNSGTLVMNYSGHGNESNLSDEELFSTDYIPELSNRNKLALLVTATCQFGRYDDINAQSGAEQLVFANNGGAIAAFTTTRVVFTSSSTSSLNFALNIQLSQKMLERDADGQPLLFGDIFYRMKNTSIGDDQNTRKFILIGDPAIRFALPNKQATFVSINGTDVSASDDTLTIKALDQVTLQGIIQSPDGSLDTGFNGEATVTLFDAPRRVSIPQDRPWIDTRGCYLNPGTEFECTYEVENDVLFKGKAIVQNGEYMLNFVVPKDISFSPDNGRIVVYAHGNAATAGGSFSDVVFNGVNDMAVNDGQGPALDVFLNDETFVNGSLSTSSPTLIVELNDSSGINTTGTGVGHEIIATIDTKPQQTYVLNQFYEGALNDFTKGRIEYPLEEIPQGSYSLKVRAWDVHNNPSEQSIFFDVATEDELVLDNVYNYPNPMNNVTSFTFEHNQQGNPLEVDIRIYTLSGRPVQHLTESLTNTSSSYASIPWNGRDRDNDRLGNGTYIYVLRVTADTPEGRTSTEKIEKLVIIR